MVWTAGVQFPAEPTGFSLLHTVQTDSGVHTASYPMGTGGCSPKGRATGAWSWPLTEVKNGGAIPPLPDTSSWHDAKLIKYKDNFTFYLTYKLTMWAKCRDFSVKAGLTGKLWREGYDLTVSGVQCCRSCRSVAEQSAFGNPAENKTSFVNDLNTKVSQFVRWRGYLRHRLYIYEFFFSE
jgi:hypothetical protein